MGKLNEVKEKIENNLKAVEYEIYEYKDKLTTDICEYEKNEIKKELSYLTGKSVSLRETLDVIEKVLNNND